MEIDVIEGRDFSDTDKNNDSSVMILMTYPDKRWI